MHTIRGLAKPAFAFFYILCNIYSIKLTCTIYLFENMKFPSKLIVIVLYSIISNIYQVLNDWCFRLFDYKFLGIIISSVKKRQMFFRLISKFRGLCMEIILWKLSYITLYKTWWILGLLTQWFYLNTQLGSHCVLYSGISAISLYNKI